MGTPTAPMTFELLDHPADIGFRAFGATPAELFANAALALVSISTDSALVAPRDTYALAAEGDGYEALLVNWLNEVLYWFDGKRIALCRFRVDALSPAAIRATASGEPRDPVRHTPGLMVKAVTWHQLKVARQDNGWIAEVYLDI